MHTPPIRALILKGPLKDLLALLWLEDPTLSGIPHGDLLFKSCLFVEIGMSSRYEFWTKPFILGLPWVTTFLGRKIVPIGYQF
jgi:hypothetical protein